MRPVLVPAARLLWRDQETLQIGRSLVVEGLDAARRTLLPLLDGTRTRAEVLLAAPGADAEELLCLLEDAGVLIDADAVRPAGLDRTEHDRLAPDVASLSLLHGKRASVALLARRQARVVVHGAGRVGGAIASLLSAAGVGTVDVLDPGVIRAGDTGVGGFTTEDVGRTRGEVLGARLRSAGSSRLPDLVVLTEHQPDGDLLVQAGTPHLVARVDGALGLVGPMVLPGSSPCLHCLELVRTAIDPSWPMISAQLDRAPKTAACDGVLAMAVASQAALQALQLLEGGTPATLAGTLELELPGWRWRRRSWPQHPGCPCAWALAASA